jgi:CubicO group peptidase (beta-lactamase class C family)
MSLSSYAARKLWQPLHAEQSAFWSTDREQGMEKAYCCWYATARDFARIGQLMLQQGNWDGNQLVDSAFAEECRVAAPLTVPGQPANSRYSMRSWWLLQYKGAHYYYARGILGQYIIVLPEQHSVMVRLGKKRGDVDEQGHPLDIYHYIDIANELLKE